MINPYSSEQSYIESTCRAFFGTELIVQRVIASDIPTGASSYTTVFESNKNEVYALCQADSPLTLGQVKRIIRGCGMGAETVFPPARNPDYFLDYGRQAFLAAYPGRKLNPTDDLSFYISLAPYTPALVKIAKVNGELRQYIPVVNKWHKMLDYSYNLIKVQ